MAAGLGPAGLGSVGAVFDHVAHAVPSIRELLPLYLGVLGAEVAGGGFNPWGGHLAVQFVFPDGARVELLEPTRSDSQSVGGFLARNPRGGLHHLTFKVPDLDAALLVLAAAGFEPFGTRTEGEGWKETYLHPRQTAGVLIQLAQSVPGIPPPFTVPIEDVLDEADEMRRATGA
jgi:methylmalonyl-CoA/ethylmalonyl-CoA epimerase